MKLKNIPTWILSGIIIFPVLLVLGIVLYILTLERFNILFWLIIPSIAFEELFETCCYEFSNNQIANLLFAIIFWFIIGRAVGWATLKVKEMNYGD